MEIEQLLGLVLKGYVFMLVLKFLVSMVFDKEEQLKAIGLRIWSIIIYYVKLSYWYILIKSIKRN